MRKKVADALRQLASALAPAGDGAAVPPPAPPLRILVAEDEQASALSLTASLARLGHEVVGLVDTELDAVVEANDLKPDMLIFDYRLREGDGVSAARTIQARRAVPCLFVTGTPDEVRTLVPDAIVIAKPALAGILSAAVSRALAKG
jgi:CheY-like chemotaxis protein